MATILLIHGFVSTSKSYFLPSLSARYGKEHTVIAPDFPVPDQPDMDGWCAHLATVGATDVDLVIAHSLGAPFALSAIGRDKLTTKGLVMISGSPGPKEHPAMRAFLRYPLDLAAVRERVGHMLVAQSYDDPWVFPEYGAALIKHLKCPGVFFADQGHFEKDALPEILLAAIDRTLLAVQPS